MLTKSCSIHSEERPTFRFDKADAIAGYAFAGAWVGLILGFTGAVGPEIASEVSLGLTVLGAVIGAILINRKK